DYLLAKSLTLRTEKNAQFISKERVRLARNLFQSSDCRIDDKIEIYTRRVQAIQDWVSLCSLHEGPRKRRAASTDSGIDLAFDDIVNAGMFPTQCPGTQCLFCLGDDQLPLSGRVYSFSRPDHLQDCHFRYLDPIAPLWCPHPSCLEVLDGVQDFQEHALQIVVENSLGLDCDRMNLIRFRKLVPKAAKTFYKVKIENIELRTEVYWSRFRPGVFVLGGGSQERLVFRSACPLHLHLLSRLPRGPPCQYWKAEMAEATD
ncbi:hypothetical protein ACJ73_08349, partial [Blastomyces percursus]